MPNTIRDEQFLDYIRNQPCVVCGDSPPNDPHHLDSGVMGSKGDDWTCVPLCRGCHTIYHQRGERHMEKRYNLNFWRESHRLLSRYMHDLADHMKPS